MAAITAQVAANRMVFFPEYTDHSIVHFELTLQTAYDLATDPTRALMTDVDAASMVASTFLHDFGMHLTVDGFYSLLDEDSVWRGIEGLDEKLWSALWAEFYLEASRFDDRKLRSLFGENYRPVRPIPKVNEPWQDFDYLLVGEFIRRHHPRLAHEIAVHGFPGKQGAAIRILPNLTEEQRYLCDIIGLVARSHGVDLRTCLDYIERKYSNKVNPRGAHVALLAVLLRIADYFQIQASRAPTERTEVQSFKSQLSEREWRVHQSVRDLHNTDADPEAIVVIATPSDVGSFLRLKQWLTGLQNELDRSWAILGEVFGRQTPLLLDKLGLRIRRVKSNLDDTRIFAKTIRYFPARVTFDTATPELLKLLIGPLYSDDIGIGVRELLQNAVDAVREIEDLFPQTTLESLPRRALSTDVLVKVEIDKDLTPVAIVVSDRGVGMTADIVIQYFLRAGASFRSSEAWRREHEDEKGHSKVLRSGRFGVGSSCCLSVRRCCKLR